MNKQLTKYIAAMLLFGSNGIVASMISLDSYEIVMFRTLIGSLMLLILFMATGGKFTFRENKKSFGFIALSGLSMGISWLFLYEAYSSMGVSLATLGYYCGPIIVVAISPLVFKERLTGCKLVCLMVAFAGILLVNNGAFSEEHNSFGVFCALMSGVMYACMVCFNKKSEKITGMENATLQLITAFITVALYMIFVQGVHMEIQISDVLPIIVLGVVNTGIGCYMYFSSLKDIKVQSVAILGYLEPVSAILLSVILLGEVLAPLQVIGAICIIAGALSAEYMK